MDHDLIIIGGGAGGLGALRAALWSKVDVLMINDGPPGGDCTFTGCVPSKTLLSSARNGASFGEAMTRVRATIERIAATESAEVLTEHGASFIKDRARLVTHDTVAVGERRISAPTVEDIERLAEGEEIDLAVDVTPVPVGEEVEEDRPPTPGGKGDPVVYDED